MEMLLFTAAVALICVTVMGDDGSQFCPVSSVQDVDRFTIDGKCYHLIENTARHAGYQTAHDDCNSRQGHLLTVKDEATNGLLVARLRQISDSHTVLLGLRRVGSHWTWTTGVAADYANWADPRGPGDCATMQIQNNGTWEQTDCAADNWYTVYICEHSKTTVESSTERMRQSVVTLVSTVLTALACFWLQ